MGRRVRAGRPIVKRTRVLQPPPGMEATRRQSQEPQECPQRHKRTGAIHGSQDSDLVASVRHAFVRQREFQASKQGESEAKQCRKLLHASPQLQDLLPEFRLREVRHFQTDHDPRRRVEPATCRRARHSEVRSNGQVPGSLNEVSEPMVITSLWAGRGRHAHDHRRLFHAAQPARGHGGPSADVRRRRDYNSRRTVQNVRGDSLAVYKAGPVFEVVAIDCTGQTRADWAAKIRQRPLRAHP